MSGEECCRACSGKGTVAASKDCVPCEGLGTCKAPGSSVRSLCDACGGIGDVKDESTQISCKSCAGSGKPGKRPCAPTESAAQATAVAEHAPNGIRPRPKAKSRSAPPTSAPAPALETPAPPETIPEARVNASNAGAVDDQSSKVEATDEDDKLNGSYEGTLEDDAVDTKPKRGSFAARLKKSVSRVGTQAKSLLPKRASANDRCSDCDGTGITRIQDEPSPCDNCNGEGSHFSQTGGLRVVCRNCKGSGNVSDFKDVPCQACDGSGCSRTQDDIQAAEDQQGVGLPAFPDNKPDLSAEADGYGQGEDIEDEADGGKEDVAADDKQQEKEGGEEKSSKKEVKKDQPQKAADDESNAKHSPAGKQKKQNASPRKATCCLSLTRRFQVPDFSIEITVSKTCGMNVAGVFSILLGMVIVAKSSNWALFLFGAFFVIGGFSLAYLANMHRCSTLFKDGSSEEAGSSSADTPEGKGAQMV